MERLTEYIGKLSDKPQAVPIMSNSKIDDTELFEKIEQWYS